MNLFSRMIHFFTDMYACMYVYPLLRKLSIAQYYISLYLGWEIFHLVGQLNSEEVPRVSTKISGSTSSLHKFIEFMHNAHCNLNLTGYSIHQEVEHHSLPQKFTRNFFLNVQS